MCLCVGVLEAPGDDMLIFVNLGLKATVSQSPLEKGISAQKTDRQRDTRYLLRWLHKLERPNLFFCVFVPPFCVTMKGGLLPREIEVQVN